MMKRILCLTCALCSLMLYGQDRGDTLHVVHYDLHLDMTDFDNRIICGYADLTVETKVPTLTQFVFDLQGLQVDSVRLNALPTTFSQVGNSVLVEGQSTMGDTSLVRIYYQGSPVSDPSWGGFYFSGQYCYNMGVAFDYQPHPFGRCWYPCLDLFTDKSTYSYHIRTEAGKMAVCDGLLTDTVRLSDSTQIWSWQLDEPIPTYLSAVAVGPYQLYADTFQGVDRVIPIQIYAQSNSIQNVSPSFIHLKEILRLYERLFGPYRWPRVGYVAVNFNSGAMEHATNIAYPNVAIDGTTNNETLYAHELFHHWFGDLVTCSRAEEMWINEGFATYAEPLVVHEIQGEAAYREYIRDLHQTTLASIVQSDGAHYALDAVPQEVTYGIHAYNKGALVIHTLRHYMGDSLFFGGLRSLLDTFAFQNINSEEFFTYLGQATQMDLMDFYEGWVHQPGFLHFSVDSVVTLSNAEYRVYLHQKLWGATHFASQNRLDLTFVSSTGALYTVQGVLFSGEYGSVDVSLPFAPSFAIVDYEEKMADALIDYTDWLTAGESMSCSNAYCTVRVEEVSDTLMVRVEHNLVSPDRPETMPDGIYRMSENHYWNVQMAHQGTDSPTGTLQFRFQAGLSSNFDYDLLQGYDVENLKLLYRAHAGDPWHIVACTRSGSPVSGSLKTETLAPGQYCLAIGDVSANVEELPSTTTLYLYPNPARQQLNVWVDGVEGRLQASIYDTNGHVVKRVRLKIGDNNLNISSLPAGSYFIGLRDSKGRRTACRFVKQ